jgi:hypothetical protein
MQVIRVSKCYLKNNSSVNQEIPCNDYDGIKKSFRFQVGEFVIYKLRGERLTNSLLCIYHLKYQNRWPRIVTNCLHI